MSRPGRGFFDDDDDDDRVDLETGQESFQSDRAAAPRQDSLDYDSLNLRSQSPFLPPLPVQGSDANDSYERGSSVATGGRTAGGGRVSSVTGGATAAGAGGSSVRAPRGNTTNGYASTRGDSPSLDDILAGGSSRGRDGRNVQQLLRAWQNEMGAPELLKFPTKVVERVVKDLARRVSAAPFVRIRGDR